MPKLYVCVCAPAVYNRAVGASNSARDHKFRLHQCRGNPGRRIVMEKLGRMNEREREKMVQVWGIDWINDFKMKAKKYRYLKGDRGRWLTVWLTEWRSHALPPYPSFSSFLLASDVICSFFGGRAIGSRDELAFNSRGGSKTSSHFID